MIVLRNWLVEQRKKCGLSQSEVAKKVGVTRQMVSAIERGENPSVDTAKKLGKALDVDWTRFYDEERKGA